MSAVIEMFTEYPEAMEKYFQGKKVIMKTFPIELVAVAEDEFPEFAITSAKQYIEYIDQELDFWKENDPRNVLEALSFQSRVNSAKTHFNNALNSYKVNNTYQGDRLMNSSISAISSGFLYSKTQLAKTVLEFITKRGEFINGFKAGVYNNPTLSPGTSATSLEGFFTALSYKGVLKEKIELTRDKCAQISENIAIANQNYADLNSKYTISFLEQELRIRSIHSQTEAKLQELNKESKKQLDDTASHFSKLEEKYNNNFKVLETVYSEHLKLEAPAQYWHEMDVEYTRKGRLWLGVSIALAVFTIGVLVLTLALLPNIFSADSHWLDVIKNSAMITVVTSIAVYLLRIFIKLSMSSFHLARDAKERNKLSYFYLALIHEGAVTDKERAIILNALFSRSDTGLLKGDSAPTMSNNVTELVDTLRK